MLKKDNIRVVVQQPSLAKYRVPLFRQWSKTEWVDLKLFYSNLDSALPNDSPEGFSAEFVPINQFRLFGRRFLWHSAQTKNASKKHCDVLVLSWDLHYLSLVPALLLAKKRGVKTILWGHGYSKNESKLRKFLRDTVARFADALVFYDFVTARRYIDTGWDVNQIHVAPNSLDLEPIYDAYRHWSRSPERIDAFQKQQGLDSRVNIIYIGRLYSDNRLDVLIRALPVVCRRHPNAQLLIIGKENEYSKELVDIAKQVRVSNHIRWFGSIYDEREIAPLMMSSAIFCYPANVGLSLVHAMAYGLPVVTSDSIDSHNPEIHTMKIGFNGFVYKHLDSVDLGNRIADALDDQIYLEMLGNNARETIAHGFTIERMVDGFMSAVTSVYVDS